MAADELCHREDRLAADPLAEPLGADDDHECRGGGRRRALAPARDCILEYCIDAAIGERVRIPVPPDRDATADRHERVGVLIEQRKLILGGLLVDESPVLVDHGIVIEELGPRRTAQPAHVHHEVGALLGRNETERRHGVEYRRPDRITQLTFGRAR